MTGEVDAPVFKPRRDEMTSEEMAAALELTGQYKVLRKLEPQTGRRDTSGPPYKHGVVLDLETTGLDPLTDEAIEIAIIPFKYTENGLIVEVLPPFSRLRQPTKPIPAKVTKLTGITNEMVEGQTIDPIEIAEIVAPADLVIAHNARFDRPVAERLHGIFAEKPWACSMTQALWAEHGFEGLKLK